MHIGTLEEAKLTESESEPQPDISEPTPPPEPETTALIPILATLEVVDGEVIEIEPPETAEDHISPKQKPYWLLIPFTILVCFSILAVSLVLPILTPTATVIIIPLSRSITTTAAIQVHGRMLPVQTLSQSTSVSATGKRHHEATQAEGTITYYNGLLSRQTIAAGTILTGADGVQIITDQAASIPPASNTTPPTFGQVTVEAHAIQPGEQGNIPPYDINGSCCGASIFVKNTTPFTGGQTARDYTVVTGRDIVTTATSLKTALLKSEQGALNAQITPGEALITPPCKQAAIADHRIGDEAKEVTITVSDTCTSIAYNAHDVHQLATQMITNKALQRFGTGYSILGDITASVICATMTDQAGGIATLTVKLDATYIYRITEGQRAKLSTLIAGKTKAQALHVLLQIPGIQGASIRFTGGDTLPLDPNHITISIVYDSN